jgi:tetratricopeptide (TPR) repeat protein
MLIPLLCVLLSAPPMLAAEAVTPAAAPSSDDQLRAQLTAFFADAGRVSPTAVGNLAQDPAAMAELRKRIASLSPEELAAMQAAFSQVPDWQAAPEALSSAFQMQVLSDEAARRAKNLEAFRTEVSEFYAALRLLPPEAVQKFNQDPAAVAEMQARIHDMPPQSLALLQLDMDQRGDWRALKAKLLSSLSPGARAGLRAFADNGPLGDRDLTDLSAFRKDLVEFFSNLKQLPPRLSAKIAPQSVAGMEAKLGRATPEMLYMIRQRIDTPELRQAMTDVRLLARAGALSDQDRAGLDRFRADLAAVYGNLGDFTPGDPSAGPLAERLASFTYEELLLARNRVESIPSWNRTLPAIFSIASTAEGRSRLALADQGSNPETKQALESFRARMVERLAALQAGAGVDPAAAAEALRSVKEAGARDLFLMREAALLVPSDDTNLQVVEIPRAVYSLSNAQIQSVSFNCSCPNNGLDLPLGIGCISLQFLCNIVAAPINVALAGIDLVVSGLQTTVSAITNVIDDVLGFVVRIIQDIANLPNVLLNALQSLFAGIANAIMSEFTPDKIAEKLGLVEGFWSSIPVLPQIPCPPDGFNLHPFGEVGDDLTASKYERYLFIFDKVIDLIPDTEISLALKIPAQVLYGGVQYLGVCLRDASMARSEQATAAFRALVAGKLDLSLTNQGNAQTGINVIQGQVLGLGSQLAQQQQEFLRQLMIQGQDLIAKIMQTGGDLTDDLQEFQDLDLRLKIEANLVIEGAKNISSFLLPRAFGGVLELVRQIVGESIDASMDAGLDVRNAEAELARGDDLFAAGDYRSAYDSFAKAYREASKGNATAMMK